MKPRPILNLSLIAVAASMPFVGNAQTTYTWDGSDSSTWSTGTNWIGDIAPVATGLLEFSGTGIVNQPTDNDNAALTSFGAISFTNDGSVGVSDAAFTLDGNSITLGGNIATTATTTGTLEDTIALDLVLDADRSVSVGLGHNLTISGDISGGFALSTPAIANPGGGVLTLSGTNTYTGDTTINARTSMRAGSNSAFSAGTVTLASTNSTLELGDVTISNPLTVSNVGASKFIRMAAGATSATYSGPIQKDEASANNFQLVAASGQTFTVSGVISGTNNSNVSVAGGGLFVFPTANLFDNQLSINGAETTVRLENNDAVGTTLGARLNNTNARFDLADGINISLPMVIGNVGNSKILALETGAAAAEWSGNMTIFENSGANNFRLISQGSGVLTLSGVIAANNANANADLQKEGTGTVVLSGANTYVGDTRISNGTLQMGVANAIPSGVGIGNFQMVADTAITATLDLNGFDQTVNAFVGNGLGTNIVDNTAVGPATLSIGNNDTGSTFEGTIQNTGGEVSLTKIGAGTSVLSGASTYTGATLVTAGTLDLTGSLTSAVTVNDGATLSGTGSTTGLLTLGDGLGAGAIVDVTVGNVTSEGLTTNIGGANVTVNIDPAATGNVEVVNYGTGTFTGATTHFTIGVGPTLVGPRAGGGDFTDTGSTISYNTGIANNIWNGGVSGDWQVGGDANWDNGIDGLFENAELANFTDAGLSQSTVTLTGSVEPSAVIIANTTGTYTINDTSAETITAVDGITASGAGNAIINATIAGASTVSKSGVGALTLAGDDSYTGATTVTEGTLTLSGDKTTSGGVLLTGSSTLNINSATALGDGTGTLQIGNGTTIDNTSGSAVTLTNNNPLILPGDGFNFTGTNDLNLGTGAVTLNLPPNNQTRIINLGGSGSTLTLGNSTSPARGGPLTTIQVDGVGNTLVFTSLDLNGAATNKTNIWSGSADVTVLSGLTGGVSGGQIFTYAGTGTFTIGGASNYTGNTNVNGGTLALGASGSLSDDTNVIINGGIIDLGNTVTDTIQSLTIIGENDGAALPQGDYGHTDSGADNGGLGVGVFDAYFSGTGVFTIFVHPFTTWGGAALFGNDANGDGVSNGLAWLLGAADPTVNALSLLPDGAATGGDLVMTFTIVDPIAPAQAFIEYTNDLTGLWTQAEIPASAGSVTVGVVDFVVVDNTGTLSVTATIPASEASVDGSLFGRLSAIEN